jgi:hypothetical protein
MLGMTDGRLGRQRGDHPENQPSLAPTYFPVVADSSVHPPRTVVAWQYVFVQPTLLRQERIDSQVCWAVEPGAISSV